ncbi:ATP-binding cassette domain-containing protein [Bordetella tumulicola]|uniref:ATP-binding cassette domain-containing protein n=1 Tax=Bordetella tumulicola TaxID=1649133 RepID=UPI0039F0A23D
MKTLTVRGVTVQTQVGGCQHLLLEDVSFELKTGEVLALIGQSGSGKSMTCAAALDLLPPGVHKVKGSVAVDDVVQPAGFIRGRLVASILQNPRSAFNPVRTIRSHAYETFKALGFDKRSWTQRIEAALIEAGLKNPAHLLNLHPFEMSGGMLQRTMIALALASEAPFLFADEPTTDLDLVVQREILDLLNSIRANRGLGILMVTHDMGVVASLADRVCVMHAGKIIEREHTAEVFYQPRTATSRLLIDAHLSLYERKNAA